jgi:hypothetical protein
VALGREDSALAVARLLAARTAEPAVALFAAELPAALALADSADLAFRYAALAAPLEAITGATSGAAPSDRARALWMLAQLAWRARRGAAGDAARRDLDALQTPAGPLGAMLAVAAGPGMHNLPALALQRSIPLVALDSANLGGDPFYRALLHIERAAWLAALGRHEQAVAALRWHENQDFVGYPGKAPQGGEVDYAFATLARWDRARLLAALGPAHRDEACAAFAAVVRAWHDGEPRFAARADTARQRLATLHCAETR